MLKFRDLIERLTLEQKVSLLISKDLYKTNSVEEFDIPSMELEQNNRLKTTDAGISFPSLEIVLNTWNPMLVKNYGTLYAANEKKPIVRVNMNSFLGSANTHLNATLLEAYISGVQETNALVCLDMLSRMDFSNLKEIMEGPYRCFSTVLQNSKPQAVFIKTEALEFLKGLRYKGLCIISESRDDLILSGLIHGASLIFTTNESAYDTVLQAVKKYNETTDIEERQQLVQDGFAISEDVLDTRINTLLDFILHYKNVSLMHTLSMVEQQELATLLTSEGSILLKNDQVLPLSASKSVAFIGASAAKKSGKANLFEEIKRYDAKFIGFAHGYYLNHLDNSSLIDAAVELASRADDVIVYLELDSFDNEFHQDELKLLDALHSSGSKPVVILNCQKLPTDLSFIELASGVLWTSGDTYVPMLDLLFARISPSGKMFQEIPGYSVGYGLGYTKFDYKNVKILELGAEITCVNSSDYDGAEGICLYVTYQDKTEIRSFYKLPLRKGESLRVLLPFDSHTFENYNDKEDTFEILGGEYILHIGKNIDEIQIETKVDLKPSPLKLSNLPLENKIDESVMLKEKVYQAPVEEVHRMSFVKKILIASLLTLYFDVMYAWMLVENINYYGFTIPIYVLIAILLLINIGVIVYICFTIIKGEKKTPKTVENLTSLVTKVDAFKVLQHEVYETFNEPEEVIEEVEVVEAEEETKDKEYVISKDKIEDEDIQEEKETLDVSFETIQNDVLDLLKQNGIMIEPSVLRSFLAGIASSKVIYLTTDMFDLLLQMLQTMCNYFDVPLYYTDLSERNEAHDLLWEEEDSKFVLTNFSRSLLAAESLKNHINFNVVSGVNEENIGVLNSVLKSYRTNTLMFDKEHQVSYQENLWQIVVLDSVKPLQTLKKREFDEMYYLNLTPYEIEPIESERQCLYITYAVLLESIVVAKKQFYLPEDYWKKIDAIEEQLSKQTKFSIGNRITLQMETFSSIMLESKADSVQTIDAMITGKLLPLFSSLEIENLYSEIKDCLSREFSEDEIPVCLKNLKKFKEEQEGIE